LQLAPGDCLLLINMHHIASDEWSYKLFFRELQTLYTGLAKGQVPTLSELPIQYSDYAAWETEWLQTEQFQNQLQYWKEQLAGNPPEVKLPVDRPRVAKENPKGAVEVNFLPPGMAKDLRSLGVTQNATLFMVLLAAFKALLHRLTNEQDLIVGSPMAGRNQVETEHIIGFFANTLPLRTQISPQMTFQELLVQVRKTVVGAFSNQDVPFEKIVEALQPQRTPGRTPFINVLFLFQTDIEPFDLPGLKTTFLDTSTDTAKFDITLFIADSEEALVTGIEYNTEMFDADTIKGLLLNLTETLQVIIRNPAQQLSNLPSATLRNNTQLCATIPDQKKSTPPTWQFLDKWFAERGIS
jgi:aspartate racemase